MFLCRSVVSRLGEYEEGATSRLAAAGIGLHLAVCRDCGRYLVQMKAVRAALAALGADPPAGATKQALTERFRAWRRARATPER